MKINAKAILKNFKGESLKNEAGEQFTVGEAISNILSYDKMGGKMKCYILAEKFYKDKEVDLDAADLIIVKAAIEHTEIYVNNITGQLLVLLENYK